MDTATDFIRPEFLNILFFQQRNIVIFPYVDLKHLHGLDIFTIGHNTIDLESTALHNVREFLEGEVNNSYSQTPNLYFIYNVDKENLNEILGIQDVRFIINTNENVRDLANGDSYIFFNKKHNQFLNYNIPDSELAFEEYLISSSENEMILQDKIQQIKSMATKIFTEVNKDSTLQNLPKILDGYDKKYWNSIVKFTENYFKINVPDISYLNSVRSPKKQLQDFSDEYEFIVSTNKQIGKEFIQLLHEYRGKKVNSANLELEELFNPQKLYNYLRNHHWKEGIPHEFIDEWCKMEFSQYTLNEVDQHDFENILKKLGIQHTFTALSQPEPIPDVDFIKEKPLEMILSPNESWITFTQWLSNEIITLERLVEEFSLADVNNMNYEDKQGLLNEILKIERLLGRDPDEHYNQVKNTKQEHPAILIVDIANILHADKDKNGKLKTGNIYKIIRILEEKYNFRPYLIADASIMHIMDDKNLYELMVEAKNIEVAPAGRTADIYVLKWAKKFNSKFLTNDLYREYWPQFGEEWVKTNRLTFMYVNGELIID
ncbi:MAG: hypothetical protein ACFFB0_16425 [Promethearchaeota archaeon]